MVTIRPNQTLAATGSTPAKNTESGEFSNEAGPAKAPAAKPLPALRIPGAGGGGAAPPGGGGGGGGGKAPIFA